MEKVINIFSIKEIQKLKEEEILILWSFLMKTRILNLLKNSFNFFFIFFVFFLIVYLINKNFVIELTVKKK